MGYLISCEGIAGKSETHFDAIISCLPSHALAPLVTTWPKEIHSFISCIPHAPLILAHLAYPKSELADAFKGQGFMVQSRSKENILSVFFPSRMVSNCCPKNLELIRVILGGARRSDLVFWNGVALTNLVQQSVRKIIKVKDQALILPCIRYVRGLPQLLVDHEKKLELANERLRIMMTGFFLAGTSYSGAGIERGVASGKAAASEATRFMANNLEDSSSAMVIHN